MLGAFTHEAQQRNFIDYLNLQHADRIGQDLMLIHVLCSSTHPKVEQTVQVHNVWSKAAVLLINSQLIMWSSAAKLKTVVINLTGQNKLSSNI